MTTPDTATVRRALAALPVSTSNHGEPPDPQRLYVPPSHGKALRLECTLVIGTRGVGKSTWAAALESAELRALLVPAVSELDRTDVVTGYATQTDLDRYPDSDTFEALLEGGHAPYTIWRGVVARWLSEVTGIEIPRDTWAATAAWVRSEPEAMARLVQSGSAHFRMSGRHGLIVFDALDRTSLDWRRMDDIVRDLLRVVLALEATGNLHGKVFLRDDQYGRTVQDFPDASKLNGTRVELTWAIHDLHGLLWQSLINLPGTDGEVIRKVYETSIGTPPVREDARWTLSPEARRDSPVQRGLFESVAGPWMGRDRRRGVPYIWSVSHLADGQGRTSPRSFLAAIRSAAEDSEDRHLDHIYPLHFESIKRGVQKASAARVKEMTEDFPWVDLVMEPLRGLTVPCSFADVFARWEARAPSPGTLVESSAMLAGDQDRRLPPRNVEDGWQGVRKDLERLGVIETRRDGRMDMPDLYRVGFGLGRKGGVRPMQTLT